MTELRKITAFVPAELLASCLDYTGEGVTETLRLALKDMAAKRAYARMLELRGKVHLGGVTLDALREDREFDELGNVIN